MHRYDVFGRLIGVRREGGRWVAVSIGEEGRHRDAKAAIPPWVEQADLARFLADLFHESASPDRPNVIYLGTDDSDGDR